MKHRHRFSSIREGRFLDLILTLDEIDPGFAGWLMRLPNERQQVVYAVLTKVCGELLSLRLTPWERIAAVKSMRTGLGTLTQGMRHQEPRQLILAHYGSCPDGFRGALGKTMCGPQGGAYYLRLHAIFAQAANKPLIKILRQLEHLDLEQVNTLTALDPIFLTPRFVSKVGTAQKAHDLTAALALIRQVVGEQANDASLRASINAIGEKTTLSEWIASWLFRAERIPCPSLNLGPDWVPLTSGWMLTDAARRFRNCLQGNRQIVRALRGQAHFFEHPGLNVIAEVKVIGPERFLVLDGVHAPGNAHVRLSLRQKVRADFLAVGVPHENWRPPECPWGPVSRLTDDFTRFMYRDELDEPPIEDNQEDLQAPAGQEAA